MLWPSSDEEQSGYVAKNVELDMTLASLAAMGPECDNFGPGEELTPSELGECLPDISDEEIMEHAGPDRVISR